MCRPYRFCGKDFSDKSCSLHVHCDSFGRVLLCCYEVLVISLSNNSKDALLQFLKMVVIEISSISAVSESIGVNGSYKWICKQREGVWVCAWEDMLEGRKPELCGVAEISVNVSQDT